MYIKNYRNIIEKKIIPFKNSKKYMKFGNYYMILKIYLYII